MPLRVIVAAILLIASGGLGWLGFLALNPTEAVATSRPAPPLRVLVAAQSLQTGVLLKDSDLRERDIPADQVPEGAVLVGEDALAEVRGAMLRRYLDAGAPLIRSDVLRRVTAASSPPCSAPARGPSRSAWTPGAARPA
jgi:pilus assembly protein CpaB